jgi:recombinational DNA repair protein RecR
MNEYTIDRSFEPLTLKEANRLRKHGIPKMIDKERLCKQCGRLMSRYNKKDICNPCNDNNRVKWERE